MKNCKKQLMIIALFFPLAMLAQIESVFNEVQMEMSVLKVSEKVKAITGTMQLISTDKPSFPLAEKKEDHLICSNVKTKHGIVEKVVFTFADDKLKYILSKGNVEAVFATPRIDTAMVYLDYEVYFKDKLFLNKKKDLAWIISNEAMHPNLFTWENPVLNMDQNFAKRELLNEVPSFLKMGASLEEMKPLIENNSDFSMEETLDGSDPNAQIQINGFGVECLGFPRKIEARFGNNKLNMVWILTGKGEEARIRKLLIAQYGAPIFVNEDWEIFNNWQVGLRKDKPEVLLLEQELGLQYKQRFLKQ